MVFQLFFLLVLTPACFVVTLRNPIYSVLALIAVFFNLALMLLCLEVEFLALVFLVVYVGAIAVLFLFVVMMLNVSKENYVSYVYYYPFLALVLLFSALVVLYFGLDVVGLGYLFYDTGLLLEHSKGAFYSDYSMLLGAQTNSQYLGQVLYSYNFVPFFLSGVVLLIAMVGSISLTVYHRPDTKRQQIFEQVEQVFMKRIRLETFKAESL